MSAGGGSRRAMAEVGWAEDSARIVWVGGRGLHHYWPLLSAYFREALLPPHRRPEADTVVWTWEEPAGAKPGTAAELGGLRRRLAEEQRWFAENLARGLAGAGAGGGPNQAGVDQLGIAIAETVGRLAALPDEALAGYVCRTEAGLRIHSWSAHTPARPTYPDTVEATAAAAEAGGPGPVALPARRWTRRRKILATLAGVLFGLFVVWAIQHGRGERQSAADAGTGAGEAATVSPGEPATPARPSAAAGVAAAAIPVPVPAAGAAPPGSGAAISGTAPGEAKAEVSILPVGAVRPVAMTIPGIAPRARGVPQAPAPIDVPGGAGARRGVDAVAEGDGAARAETAGGRPQRGAGAGPETTTPTTGAIAIPEMAIAMAVREAEIGAAPVAEVGLKVREMVPAAPQIAKTPTPDERPAGAAPVGRIAAAEADDGGAAEIRAATLKREFSHRIRIRLQPAATRWLGDRVLPTMPQRVDRASGLPAAAERVRRQVEQSRPSGLEDVTWRAQIKIEETGTDGGALPWLWETPPRAMTLQDGTGRKFAEIAVEAEDEILVAWHEGSTAVLELETAATSGWAWRLAAGGAWPPEWQRETAPGGMARVGIPLVRPVAGSFSVGVAWVETASGWAKVAEVKIEAVALAEK